MSSSRACASGPATSARFPGASARRRSPCCSQIPCGRRNGAHCMFDANRVLAVSDPELWRAIEGENRRQEDHIELIASENYVSPAVLGAAGWPRTKNLAGTYTGGRYY